MHSFKKVSPENELRVGIFPNANDHCWLTNQIFLHWTFKKRLYLSIFLWSEDNLPWRTKRGPSFIFLQHWKITQIVRMHAIEIIASFYRNLIQALHEICPYIAPQNIATFVAKLVDFKLVKTCCLFFALLEKVQVCVSRFQSHHFSKHIFSEKITQLWLEKWVIVYILNCPNSTKFYICWSSR